MDIESIRERLTELVAHGLCVGTGTGKPGNLCSEQAVALAAGEPLSDKPACVAAEDRVFAVRLNDALWPSKMDRAHGMLPLLLAQLGTAGTDRTRWVRYLVEGTIRRVLPYALRRAAISHPDLKHRLALEAAARDCEEHGTRESAQRARRISTDADAYTAYTADAAYAVAYAYAAYAVAVAANAARCADCAGAAALLISVEVALDAYRRDREMP